MKRLTILTLTLIFTRCGNGTEPLSALNNGDSSTLPQLTVPYAISTTNVNNITAYSATNDGFDFNLSLNLNGNYAITAPLKGVVTAASTSSVTIYHNARLSTVISRFNASVTPGTVVNTGTQIGTSPGYTIHFSTIIDGSVVCPYFFLTGGDSAQKTHINQKLMNLGALAPCN